MCQQVFLYLFFLILTAGCNVLKKSSRDDVEEGVYKVAPNQVFRSIGKDSIGVFKNKTQLWLLEQSDTLWFYTHAMQSMSKNHFIYPLADSNNKLVLTKTSFDFDVFTTPFKYRFATMGMPPQMNTAFNGSFYIGYRKDKLSVKKIKMPFGMEREKFKKTGLGFGCFAGVGSVFISPSAMQNSIDFEYDGFVIDYGVALLVGIRNLSTGLSLGFDFLPDKNGKKWIYQHKPWLGIFIGLNLN